MPSLGLFILIRCITTPWIFDCTEFSSMSNLEIYLRDPLRYWGSFSFSTSPTFLEGVPKWSENLSNHPRVIWIDYFLTPDPPIILEVSALVYGLLFYSALIWRVSLGSCLSQKVPYFIGAPKLSEGLLRACERCSEKFSPWLLVLSFSNEEGILGSLPWYPMVLLWWLYFLFTL